MYALRPIAEFPDNHLPQVFISCHYVNPEITVRGVFSHLELCTVQGFKNTLAIDLVQVEGQLDI